MARLVHITQSNYSKVEKGLHRLSYEELKYLSKANIDIFYIFTGYRCAGKHVEYFQQCTYVELCCYLGIIYISAKFLYEIEVGKKGFSADTLCLVRIPDVEVKKRLYAY